MGRKPYIDGLPKGVSFMKRTKRSVIQNRRRRTIQPSHHARPQQMSPTDTPTTPHTHSSRQTSFILVGMVTVGILAVVLIGMFTDPNLFAEGPEKTVLVSHGLPFSAVVESLDAAGVIRGRFSFIVVATLTGSRSHVQSGKYVFRSGLSHLDLLRALRDGIGTVHISVTVAEGLQARRQAQLFRRSVGVDSSQFMTLVHDEAFARSLGVTGPSLEGYLFPGTYDLPWQPDAGEVIRRMVDRFLFFYHDTLHARTRDLGLTTHEVVTLASIVEGEAMLKHEMPIISGVYHNRLRKGMRLQADPTIQYLLDDAPRRLFHADLLIDSPYNTYRTPGLPPGPVNNPGRDALLAALYPDEHAYMFFVADGRGGHWFSTTFREHGRNVQRYRTRFRAVLPDNSVKDTLMEVVEDTMMEPVHIEESR